MSLDQSMTRVISVRGRNRAELLADPVFVYVGRASIARAGARQSSASVSACGTGGRTDNGAGQKHAARLFELRLAEAIAGDASR